MSRLQITIDEVFARVAELRSWLSHEARETIDDVPVLSKALSDPQKRRSMLVLLSMLPPERTESVISHVVPLAVDDRDAVIVRQLLGRLSRHRSRQLVAPVVDALLDDADDHDYRRLAELLDFLGLSEVAEDLCRRAADSPDEGISEVAKEFGR